MNTVLDFDDNNGAFIEILQIQDYSLIVNHWKNPHIQLEEIEGDLLYYDSEERKLFLEKMKRILLEEYIPFIDKNPDGDDKMQEIIDELYEKMQDPDYDIFSDLSEEEKEQMERYKELDNKNYSNDNWVSCFEEIKEKSELDISLEAFVDENFDGFEYDCLTVHGYRLKHSLAWYLMNNIDKEIKKIGIEIEIQEGFLKIVNSMEETINIIRISNSPLEARDRLMLQFPLSKLQAKSILETTLRDLTSLLEEHIENYIKFLEDKTNLLRKLKNSNTMDF